MSERYYIHDTTLGYVGNSLVWWRKGHHGYTCDIKDAHVFRKEEAIQTINDSDDLVAYSVDIVERMKSPDGDGLDHVEG